MTLEVIFRDKRGNYQSVECTHFEEGNEGLVLIENPGSNEVGFIPYDNLEHVTPKSD